MNRLYSFEPVIDADCRVLILGTMPSAASLAKAQYYGNPHNQFWPLLSQVFGEICPEDYPQRLALALRHHVALWDVAGSCLRQGSLDSAIRDVQINDFEGLFAAYPKIKYVFFNGKTAQRLYDKIGRREDIDYAVLPSTSPANTQRREMKLEAWMAVRDAAEI